MRQPSAILFLLACLLAVVPLMRRSAAQDRCQADGAAESGVFDESASACMASQEQEPEWVEGLGFLAVLSLTGGVITGAVALRNRRREAQLLRGAGVDYPS